MFAKRHVADGDAAVVALHQHVLEPLPVLALRRLLERLLCKSMKTVNEWVKLTF